MKITSQGYKRDYHADWLFSEMCLSSLEGDHYVMQEENLKYDLKKAHKCSFKNRESLKKDEICGCFYCRRIFSPAKIFDWTDEPEGTAICPHCGIDSIIGENSGFPITEEFLEEMHEAYFK
jgi:hypothetical protein